MSELNVNSGWFAVLNDVIIASGKNEQEVKQRLNFMKSSLDEIKLGQAINEKLKHQARQLVELKITAFNGDKNKSKDYCG